MEEIGRAILMGLVVQYQATLEKLNLDERITPPQRVELLASLSDAFNKATAASRRILPETNQLAIALDVITLFSTFISEKHPALLKDFVRIIDGFGAEVEAHYG